MKSFVIFKYVLRNNTLACNYRCYIYVRVIFVFKAVKPEKRTARRCKSKEVRTTNCGIPNILITYFASQQCRRIVFRRVVLRDGGYETFSTRVLPKDGKEFRSQ